MLAVVRIAGQQFKVQAGDTLYVPHLAGSTGDKVTFNDILFTETEGKIAVGNSEGNTVVGEILNDLVKGDKVIAFKMKRRKGFRKKKGHRTQYTFLKIDSVGGDTAPVNATEETAPEVEETIVTETEEAEA